MEYEPDHAGAATGHPPAPSARTYSIASRIERLPAGPGLRRIVLLIAIGGWFEFYELFMPGGIAHGLLHDGIYTIKTTGILDYASFPSFLASFFFGMFLSTLMFSRLSDKLGRRAIFVWSMVVYSLFNVFIAFSSSPAWIDLFRFGAGFGVGIQLINNDSYLSEILPGRLRGRYMTLAMVLILTATPIAVLVGTAFTPYAPFGIPGWRLVVLVGAAGGILVWFIQRGIPESPRWLASRGRLDQADAAMRLIEASIESTHGPLPTPDDSNPEAGAQAGRWTEIFSRFYLKRTIALSVLQFCQTIAVFGFGSWVPIMLVSRGYTIVHSLAYTTVILLSAPLGGLLGMYFSERLERKWQLVWTSVGIGAFGFAFALATSLPLILLSGLLFTLSNNWLIAVFHPYAAELFPTRIKAQAIGFTFCWSRVSAIFVGYWVAAILATHGQVGVFVMIGGAMALIVVAIGVFGPRTNGRRIEELAP
jgi:putative MFS transporter